MLTRQCGRGHRVCRHTCAIRSSQHGGSGGGCGLTNKKKLLVSKNTKKQSLPYACFVTPKLKQKGLVSMK